MGTTSVHAGISSWPQQQSCTSLYFLSIPKVYISGEIAAGCSIAVLWQHQVLRMLYGCVSRKVNFMDGYNRLQSAHILERSVIKVPISVCGYKPEWIKAHQIPLLKIQLKLISQLLLHDCDCDGCMSKWGPSISCHWKGHFQHRE